jgi:phospholipid/cholesterol/gamma-HCH transport system substrate-binding protein
MDTKINYTIVGAFVVSLTAAIVLGIIWLSSGFSTVENKTYTIYMRESVSGLSIDSPVEFNGVNVGSVDSVAIDPKDPEVVEITISINRTTPVTQGTIATLKSKGITGITFIALSDHSEDLRPLVKPEGESYPVIKAGPSLFVRIDTALNNLSENLSKVSESVQTLLSKENQRSITNVLFNLDRVTAVLSVNSQKLNTIINNTAIASKQLSPLILSSSGAAHILETQTLPATYRLLSNLDNATRTLNQVMIDIKQNPSVLIRGSAQPTLGPGETR